MTDETIVTAQDDTKADDKGAAATGQDNGGKATTATDAASAKPGDKSAQADGKSATTQGDQQAKAPEKYELKLAENSPLDQSDIDKVSAFAKEKGLSNEQAQALLDQRQEAAGGVVQRQTEKLKQTQSEWVKELKADPEFGGDNLDTNGRLAYQALERFGDAKLIEDIKASGFNHHPGLFRFLSRIGKAMAEDKPLSQMGGGKGSTTKTAAESLYGSTQT